MQPYKYVEQVNRKYSLDTKISHFIMEGRYQDIARYVENRIPGILCLKNYFNCCNLRYVLLNWCKSKSEYEHGYMKMFLIFLQNNY